MKKNKLLFVAHTILLIYCLIGTTGCQWIQTWDQHYFAQNGQFLLKHPPEVSIREILLDDGTLTGSDLVLSGQLVHWDEHGTYLQLSDSYGRILVVLIELPELNHDIPPKQRQSVQQIKVWGTLEHGKRGQPFIRARSLYIVKENTSVAIKK